MDLTLERKIGRGQAMVFGLLWVGYASYYLCRMNFSIGQPAIMAQFGWTEAQVGLIPSVYSLFYAIGQFTNGQIGSRIGARLMMGIGLLGIGLVNLAFSQTTDYTVMLVLWGVNGYLQATGWPLVVQTMSNWFRVGRRGTMMALISTSYQVGNVLAWLLAGFLVESWGWKAAFYVPALWCLPVGALVLFLLRNEPEDMGLPHIRDDLGGGSGGAVDEGGEWTVWRILKTTLSNKMIWNLAMSYFCFNAVRYTFMNWAPQYFVQYHHQTIKGSAFLAVVFPLIGALGALASGWISDRFFDSRRAPVCSVFLLILSGMCLAFIPIASEDTFSATLVLAVAGFVIYGADATLTGAAAVDLSHPKAAASAAGFIMAMGNFGSMFVAGAGVGEMLTKFGGDWSMVFSLLAGLSLVAAALAAVLWNQKPKKKS